MIQKLLILFLLMGFPFVLFAQQGSIRGRIVGPGNEPLFGINIKLEPEKSTTRTDELGNFQFTNIADGSYIIVASGVGYQARSRRITVQEGKAISLNLELNIETETLKEVMVTGRSKNRSSALTRTNTPLRDIPQNIQTVDRAVLQDQQLFRIEDVFKNVAGITSYDSYGGFSSRGYSSSASGITVNGIKGSMYPEGQTPLLGNIESVEVIHGPSAILNGSGGMGGNINLVTKQPKKQTTLNASVSAGSLDLFRTQADVTGSITKNKALYYLAGIGYQTGGAFTDLFHRRNLQAYGSVKWEIGDKTHWQVDGNYVYDDASNNYQPLVPTYDTPNPDSTFLAPYTFNVGYGSRYIGSNYHIQSMMEHRFSDKWKLNLQVGISKSRANRKQYSVWSAVSVPDNTVERSFMVQNVNSPQTSVNLYTSGQLKTWNIKHTFTVGTDLMRSLSIYPKGISSYDADPVNVYAPPVKVDFDTTGRNGYISSIYEKFSYRTLGAYVMDQIELTSKLKVLAGLRYNNYFRRFYSIKPDGSIGYNERPLRAKNYSPRLGLVYQPITPLSVYFDYNEGFEPHYSNDAETGGPFDPETAKQYEVGAKGEFWGGKFQPFVTIYQSTKKNVLQSAPKEGFPYWQVAIGEVRSRGIELGIKGSFFSSLFVTMNYNHNNTEITESKKPEEIGQLFANSPRNSANGWAKYSFTKAGLKGFYVGAGFQYVDARYMQNKKTGDNNIKVMPAYTLADALLGYRYKEYALQVNGNNLFDKRYALSGSWDSYTPGMPRNFLITLSYSMK